MELIGLRKRTYQTLPVTLTEEERHSHGENLAREMQALTRTTRDKKAAAAQFKAREDAHNATLVHLSKLVETGIDYREVECEERIDTSLRRVVVTRLDTGEVVTNRALTREEWQTAMTEE